MTRTKTLLYALAAALMIVGATTAIYKLVDRLTGNHWVAAAAPLTTYIVVSLVIAMVLDWSDREYRG